MNKTNYYVIIMRRWGGLETHSYLLGVFEEESPAREAAEAESKRRGGKYNYEIYHLDSVRPKFIKQTISTCQPAMEMYFEYYNLLYFLRQLISVIKVKLVKLIYRIKNENKK